MSTAAETLELNGKLRDQKGKGASRRLRSQGGLPAILYGQKDNLPLTVNPKELKKILESKGKNALIHLNIDGDSKKSRTVLLKNHQTHPMRTAWVHVDFLEIDMTHKIKIEVPVKFVGLSAGEKKGGIANHILRNLHVECLPSDIPASIEVQMAEVELNQVVHVSDLKISDKIRVLNRPSEAVVSVFQEKEEVKAVATPAEGEAAAAAAPGAAPAAGAAAAPAGAGAKPKK
jgi:large subunit ribosomal protein L25